MYTIFIIFIFALLITFVYAGHRGAPWVPTKKNDVERFLCLANILPGQKMYDLGCGDARLVCAAAKVGARAQGLDLSLFPLILAGIRRLFQPNRKNIKLSWCDFWRVDLADADVVYFFLMPAIYLKLKAKLEKELKTGAKVVAYVWPIDGWEPVKVDEQQGYPKMYLYEVKV